MGTEEFWIPAAIAAVASGAQYVNTSNANKRQDAAEADAIRDQQAIQGKAAASVNKTVQGIQQDTPTKIAQTATGQYVQQLRKNAAGAGAGSTTSALAPVSGSSRYKGDVSRGTATAQDFGNNAASEMGGLDAATRLRQNEGLSMQDLGTNLNTLGAESYSKNFVDQLRAQVAGQPNPWVSLFSGMVKNGALAYASGAGGAGGAGKGAAGGVGAGGGVIPASNYNILTNPGGSLYA